MVGNRVHHRAPASGVHVNSHAILRAVILQKCREGNRDPVVHALAQHLALAFTHADQRVGRSADTNLLAQRIARAEHVIHNVAAHQGNVGAVRVLDFSERAPGGEIQIGKRGHRPGPAAHLGVGGGFGAVNHRPVGRSRRPHRYAGGAIGEDGFVIVEGDVFPLLEREILVHGDEGLRHFADRHHVRAIGLDLAGHKPLGPVGQGDDRDHGCNPDDHAQQREDRAHLVGPQ